MSIPRFRWVAFSALLAAAAPVLFAMDFSPDRDQLWARFTRPVKFADLLLPQGNYLFVHDDEKSAMMEPCLYVYAEDNLDEPLVAVHCIRRVETASERDRIVWGAIRRDNMKEFGYIQFAGDVFAHYAR